MASAIGVTFISTILPPMAARAMDIIKDKGLTISKYIAVKAVDKATDRATDKATDKAMDKAMDTPMAMVVDKIKREISNQQKILCMIQGIVQVAEEKQIDDVFIRNWLRDLVDIGYEARDVLDDFIIFSSCVITAEESSNRVNFNSSVMLSYFGGLSSDTSKLPVAILNRFEEDFRSVREKFDEKKKQGETFRDLRSVAGGRNFREHRRPIVGPSINKQRDGLFLGREEMKQEIVEKILRPSDDRVDVVVIWGMGGIGKTTLAQSIYNDERVKIVPRKWLCGGESKFCAEKVITKIIGDSSTDDVERLQEKLVKKFEGNRFLIVLDDVWDVDGSEWDLLFNPLTEVGKGGMIIITRRERQLCDEITSQTAYNLQPLSEEDSWSIFESCAYVNGKADSTSELKPIGEQIVKKLNGHPLALKVVGRSLLKTDSNTWKKFLESKFTKDEVMSALRWSYNHLPRHLKTCFTYCALFPKDHVLDKKVLVEMWMAHDLIQKEEQERPEDVGAQYFEELVNASLLQCVDGKHVMHDLIQDLALLVSNGEFVTANSSLTNDQMETVRHVTITRGEYSKVPRLCKMEKLLTLYTTDDEISQPQKYVLDVFNQPKSIRVLVLFSWKITDIPDCISELRHLRYLDVSGTKVGSLPDSLCRLYNLQMLAAPPDTVLPRDIVNISSLRYVRASLSTCKGVGKLTSLQELSSIHVCEGDNIRELGDMPILRGKLRIRGLGNVEKLEDDIAALMEKQTLMDELKLVFNQHFQKSTISVQVLDALGCPPNLTNLRIEGYTGVQSPSWMVDGKHKFDKLQTLGLDNCSKLESLPPLGELASLKHLSLQNVGVKRLGDEFYGKFTDGKVFFPSLESLYFSGMNEWEEWDDIIIENSGVTFFPRLTILKIKYCAKLLSVLLVVENPIMNAANFMTSLKELKIWNCDGLKRLQLDALVSLKKLVIHGCDVLKRLQLDALVSLKELVISNCSSLVQITSAICELTSLSIDKCPQLQSLPADWHFMTSLSHLEIRDCDGLKRLQLDALVSLKALVIKCCSSLVQITSARCESLEISSCRLLEKMDVAKCDSLVVIKFLTLEDCESLRSLSIDIHGMDSLEDLRIGRCPKLELAFEDGSSSSSSSGNSVAVRLHYISTDSTQVFRTLLHQKLVCLEYLEIRNLGGFENFDETEANNFCKLRSLKILYITQCEDLSSLPTDFHKLSSLKELVICHCPQLQSLPADWHFMTSLSYLKIRDCDGLKRLQLDALVSLKELVIKRCSSLVQITSAICESLKISSCRLLEKMDVARCDSLQVVIKIWRLEDCESLRSLSIDIHGLDSLKDLRIDGCPKLELAFEDGSSSSSTSGNSVAVPIHNITTHNTQVFITLLHHKLVSLESLEIRYLGGFENFDETEANNFCKLRSLKRLYIMECEDLSSLPTDFHKLSSLEDLYIRDCPQLQSLPPDFHKLSSLKKLVIDDCPQLQSLPAFGFPPSLTYLITTGCLLLYERCKDESGLDWPFMTSLSHLEIRDYDGLKRLQLDALVSLKKLVIKRCSSLVQITSARCESLEISSCRLLEKMDVARCDSLVVIKFLTLEDCESLRSLSIDIHGLDSLEDLRIDGCPKLELAFEDGSSSSSSSGNSFAVRLHYLSTDSTQVFRTLHHHKFVSLKSLEIRNLGGFENFDETEANNFCKLRSLKRLYITQCEDLSSLPADFHKLSSLKKLDIYDCPQLQSLPADGLPPSLTYLSISGCPLLYKRCKDESGLDWHKINHIPERRINIGSRY